MSSTTNKEPAWLDGKAKEAINRLREAKPGYPHIDRMVLTIFAIVDARLAGKSDNSVFGRPEVCNKTTFYRNWMKDEEFSGCLETVTRLARSWNEDANIRALHQSRELMVLAAPRAAERIVSKMMTGYNEHVVLRAAERIIAVAHDFEDQLVVEKIVKRLDLRKFNSEQMARIRKGEHPLLVIASDYLLDD